MSIYSKACAEFRRTNDPELGKLIEDYDFHDDSLACMDMPIASVRASVMRSIKLAENDLSMFLNKTKIGEL